ncbi:MAG TPA: hypothetical protein VGC66_00630 [Pyrinomonadaceae bacterium]|jgi:hypothetical protein
MQEQALNETALRPTEFSLDTYGDQVFSGYTLDEEWNGWACPYFTYDQALLLVEAHRSHGWRAHYEEENDAFVFSFEHDGLDTPDTFPSVTISGRKFYPVGAFGWIWEESVRSKG